MRKSLRLTLAAATGAAVLATGGAITVASPVYAASFGAVSFSDAFLPPSGSDSIGVTVKVTAVYDTTTGKADKKLCARFTKDKSVGSPSFANAPLTQPADVAPADAAGKNSSGIDVKGSIPVGSGDTASDKWEIQFADIATSATCDPSSSTGWSNTTSIPVVRSTRVSGVSIDPDPVVLKSGKDIDVFVEAKIEFFGSEKLTAVDLESKDGDDSYALGTNGLEADGQFHDSTSFDYTTDTGAWQVDFTITRGSKTYHFVKGFDVKKSGTTTAKAKSKIKLAVKPSIVTKGKTFKLYGQAYRGYTSWGAWSKKILRVYFKKKGTKTWKFLGYIETSSTGKFSHTYKPKYSGYWRVYGAGTSKTNKAYSNYKLVTVK